ncbi:hypothetical protein ASE74_10140 [Pedobacter sp. Leaf216]|uniref:hypothetical protein n=1 Tax=Pedobacter sp. Leaf216 TaxID=1735684 RepID=UPI0006F82B17|nr:hypothetical protein [Pedobacter sp. Leaf216]KQM65221.1 hypothetical protein ASE74_10140 [Pedobacter sp. Leaf216]
MNRNYEISATYEQLLQRISTALLLNANFSSDRSLSLGKMGSAVFLYHYSEYRDEQILFDFANELLLETITDLKGNNIDYTVGLTGIGAAIRYLSARDFVDISDQNTIFTEIDFRVEKKSLHVDLHRDSVGVTRYLLEKIDPIETEEIQDINLLLQLERIILHIEHVGKSAKIPDPISHLNMRRIIGEKKDLINLINLSEDMYLAVGLLNATLNKGICKKIASDYREVLLAKNNENLVQLYATLKDYSIEKDWVVCLNLLIKTYYISYSSGIQNILANEDFPAMILNMVKDCKDADFSILGVSLHTETISLLQHINMSLKKGPLEEAIDTYISYLILNIGDDIIEAAYQPQIKNIGLDGISGLAMAILSRLDYRRADWHELSLAF